MRTAIRSAADIDEVGCPDPAAVLQRIESTRSCWPSCRANSRSVLASVSVVTVISLPTTDEWRPSRDSKIPGSQRVYGVKSTDRRAKVDSEPNTPNRRGANVDSAPNAPNRAVLTG